MKAERIEPGRVLSLAPAAGFPGYFVGFDPAGKAGDLYRYAIDRADPLPDFVSHFQPRGVLEASEVVDAQAYVWQTRDWQRPAWNGQVVYEVHLGTFTQEGTYRSAIEKLPYLAALGITALELMPLADFAGERNWGYDGVMPFAPSRAYGRPDDLRALVDACHAQGLCVILDIVFNHLGPEGNFSHAYSSFYFHEGKDNPWGQNFNFDGPHCAPVRALARQNIRYWLEEFRIDGFRMDATHMVHDESRIHLLAETAEEAQRHGGFMIAEDDRNVRSILQARSRGGWGFDGVWADDFHHVIRVSQTRERQHFFRMVEGTLTEIADTIQHGWYYRGQISPFHQAPRGEPCDDFSPQSFVYQISNHDQVGNRLYGDRLHQCISPESYRALSLFLLLTPYTPLLFMGQEWATSAPFFYFTDMSEDLGKKIEEGRKREFLATEMVHDPELLAHMLQPQDREAFVQSKLPWHEIERPRHRRTLELYRAGLKLRKRLFGAVNPPRATWQVEAKGSCVQISYKTPIGEVIVQLDLLGLQLEAEGELLMSSNASSFVGNATIQPGPVTTAVKIG